MATLTVTTTSRAGLDLPTTAVSATGGGDKWANDGTQLLYIENTDSVTVTVTIAIGATVDGQAVTARTVAVAQNKRMLVGPFPQTAYNDGSGFVNLTYTGVTALKVAIIRPGS